MDEFCAAGGEMIEVRHVVDDRGVALLRIKIIDGAKFHHIDLDAAAANGLAESIRLWAQQQRRQR